jgi:transformation/transcription domain-associated protein
VISLLFRSLASVPIQCVNAAHDALRDVLTLSVVSDGGKSKSRLRKELLQTCIRPVLLNLRDYTRLSVYLLRGLSRLLSLLSSWFNKTLGEKLLDHLQKWTDPGRMKSQKIWHEGEEPDVAAAIIDLFVLLPHASHFVEPLVKTTIKLEACLPAFQSRYTLSPYRKPLARYLNKHSQNTIAFFLQRLKTPLYSEIFQDVIAFPESSSLREYLARRESSVSLLNVCFERPLGIIRSEKAASTTPSPGGYPTNPSGQQSMKELFSLHGIHPFTASPTQKEISLKQDVESKKKKLQILQQELNRAKEMLGKTSQAGSNAPPTEIEEAKKKLKMAKAAVDRGTKDLNDSRQKYATEMAQIKVTQAPQVQDSQTRPMTIEALELQHQGFLLVKTLIVNDRGYFGEHNDVLRAFRWLWRSKGRYLRLQHEDSVPPRYHDESKLLATILVDYSESSPSDVDLLFELIRIFLQPGSCDFSFVRYSLSAAVTNLSLEQKKQILQRFFALLSGESSEEIKTLSLQLVVYPMLQTFFKEKQTNPNNLHMDRETSSQPVTDIIDAATARRFVMEVLFNNDKPIHCGDRLKVELLKMTNILIEFVPEQMELFGKEIVKFCLSFLKSDDASCKSWAYLVLCRHISATNSGTNLILQVYSALIRAHQPEGKDIIRAALDLLIPAMERRLTESEKKKATEFANRIMFEEVNSVPQLAHIWAMVVSHSVRYYDNRHHFVRHMINSLTRLGLPPNAPPENRSLSVSVVELVLLWHRMQEDENEGISGIGQPKRKIPRTESAASSDEKLNKKVNASMSGVGTPEKNLPERSPLLDQAMVRFGPRCASYGYLFLT